KRLTRRAGARTSCSRRLCSNRSTWSRWLPSFLLRHALRSAPQLLGTNGDDVDAPGQGRVIRRGCDEYLRVDALGVDPDNDIDAVCRAAVCIYVRVRRVVVVPLESAANLSGRPALLRGGGRYRPACAVERGGVDRVHETNARDEDERCDRANCSR